MVFVRRVDDQLPVLLTFATPRISNRTSTSDRDDPKIPEKPSEDDAKIPEKPSEDATSEDLIDFGSTVVTTEPVSLLHKECLDPEPGPPEETEDSNPVPVDESKDSPEEKLMQEFPLLHSLAKTVGGT